MLREAELYVMAEDVTVEVLGRIRPQDADVTLPQIRVDHPGPTTMTQALDRHAAEDARLVAALGGDGSARAAAAEADGEDAAAVLLAATVSHALLAHYVAAHLGSTACPLPEELARPLWELTAPDAGTWRARGWFRRPLPLPDHVSWRDRFLLTAGHQPHPLAQ